MTRTKINSEQRTSFIADLQKIVANKQIVLAEDLQIQPYLQESRGRKVGKAMLVILPETKQEISQIVSLCERYQISIVTQGGNTGRCFGAFCADENSVIISLTRMNKIIDLDQDNATITVEAGCTLLQIKDFVAEQQLFFPLTIGAQGSCQIGGNLATNAGGVNTLRYGNMRDLTLGIEAVVADGNILSDLNKLRKNNTGYDLKSLFIGSEGTLGIITAAVLQLYQLEQEDVQGLIAVDSIEKAIALLSVAKKCFNQQLTVFELIPQIAVDALMQHTDISFPLLNELNQPYPFYIWYQVTSNDNQQLSETEAQFFEAISENDLCSDACVAQNQAQRNLLVKIRELIVEVQSNVGKSIKFDIAVPISNIARLINIVDENILIINNEIANNQVANNKIGNQITGNEMIIKPYPFGHLGDGNIHLNILFINSLSGDVEQEIIAKLERLVYELVAQLNGSFSAEHGIGALKLDLMQQYKNPVALDMMRRIKLALDPLNIFNPQKVIPDSNANKTN